MASPNLLALAGQKSKPDAKTLNTHLTSSPISSTSSPYAQCSTPLQSSSPFQPSYNARGTPSPSSSPPREFASPVSPPVPGYGMARNEPQTPALNALDKVYEQSEHSREIPAEGYRMIGAGGVGNPWPIEKRPLKGSEGDVKMGDVGRKGGNLKGLAPSPNLDEGVEVRNRKAMKALQDHVADRMPYVQLSSKRMQAVMGVKNELAFEVPDVKRSSASVSIPALPSGLDAGHSLRTASRNPSSTFKFVNPLSPHTGPSFDPNTGKGLREWLLSKGKEYGMYKQECRSISFHDFTPDMRTNGWSNKVLGHYAANSASERVDFYEVELPTPTGATQPWIWFLISRPLLTINAKNTSTRPPHQNKISHPSTNPQFFTPSAFPSSPFSTSSEHTSALPPNCYLPVQTSWLVFACPTENVTAYPEAIDAQPPSSLHSRLPYRPSSSVQNGGGKKVYKRRDFDFSHNGIPAFEFHAPALSTFQPELQFLDIGEIGPFYPGDDFASLSAAQYAHNVKASEDANAAALLAGKEAVKKVESPFYGQWWQTFYEGVSADVARWEGIRSAMARGKCRVVVRYAEFEGEAMDVDEPIGLGLSVPSSRGYDGFNGGLFAGMGDGKKKERLAGRQRLTRSESRRRSGLGIGECSSGVVIGVGAASGIASRKGKGKAGKK